MQSVGEGKRRAEGSNEKGEPSLFGSPVPK
jgi:hypothetical protein